MKPYRSSASQVSTAELCLRKWAGEKIAKLPTKPNRFAVFGTSTHNHAANWFTHRTPPPDSPEGRCARAIVAQLPPPQTPGIEIEQEINLAVGGVRFKGYVDFRILSLEIPFVSDHKTTSDLCWAKGPDDLIEDVQATLYAFDAMSLTNTSAADLQWTYATRHKRTQVRPVRRRVTLAEIQPRLDKTAETVNVLRELHEAQPHWLDVPYDAAGCEAYGGCPFQKEECNLTPTERIQSIMSQEQAHSAFLQKLKSKRGNGTAAPHPPPAAAPAVNPPDPPKPSEAVTEPPLPKTKTKRKRRTKAEIAADKAAKAAPTPAADKPSKEAAAAPTPMVDKPSKEAAADTPDVLETYRKGFLDGFKAAREVLS